MARRLNRRSKQNKSAKRTCNYLRGVKAHCKKTMTTGENFVLNLSRYNLSEHELSLLSKGLKFIPTPKSNNAKNVLLNDFEEFARKLRCKFHFDTGDNTTIHPFKTKSGYKPPFTCSELEEYIDKTKLELSSMEIVKKKSNISESEKAAILSLKNNSDIVIKKADKSNTIVIMNKNQYVLEAQRQLQSKHYMQVSEPNMLKLHDSIQNKLAEMHTNGSLDKDTYKFFNDKKPSLKCGHLYLLPKTHKIPANIYNALMNGQCSIKKLPPGRPIISQCDTPTRKIGQYCDYFLVPIVQKQSTYIKDTTDFITKIESLTLPTNALLITYDVTSMYTNMEFNELLSSVNEAYTQANKTQLDIPYPNPEDLIFLLKCVLENNYFEFDGKYYKQIIGASMGAVPSPEICDIRMYQITQHIMAKFRHASKIVFHGRYRDDGFIIFNGTQSEIEEFFNIGNHCHKHLRFTFEISTSAVNFLDTTVYKGPKFQNHNKLDIKSFIKPTNNFQYLHRQSAHSPAVFKGFIKGECIRHARNTTDPEILLATLNDFKAHLSKRGYSTSEIDPTIEETINTNRSKLIIKHNTEQPLRNPTVLVTKFNPCVKGLKKRILKYWNTILRNPECKTVLNSQPIIAYSKHKNIGDKIIRSHLKQTS